MEDKAGDDRPIEQLKPFSDDIRELILRALEKAEWPTEYVEALREYDDPRPRQTLPDGTEVIVEYVAPVPDQKIREALREFCFRSFGNPIGNSAKTRSGPVWHGRRDRVVRAWETLGFDRGDFWQALYAADCDDSRPKGGSDRRTLGERVWDALSDIPDPNDEDAYREWAEVAEREVLAALACAVPRYVLGKDYRAGEGAVSEDVPDDPAQIEREAARGRGILDELADRSEAMAFLDILAGHLQSNEIEALRQEDWRPYPAAKIVAQETGDTVEAVRSRIRRGLEAASEEYKRDFTVP